MYVLIPIGHEHASWVIAWHADGSYRYVTATGGRSFHLHEARRFDGAAAGRFIATACTPLPA